MDGATGSPGTNGTDGADGTNGIDGKNAYSVLTDIMAVPLTAGGTVTADVDTAEWMVVGQLVIVGQGPGAVLPFPGPATFTVTSFPSTTSVVLTWLEYPGDVGGGVAISAGAIVSLSFPMPDLDTVSAYAVGTAYSVTAVSLPLTFGTTSPIVTIDKPGTWLIMARVRWDYNGATFGTERTVFTRLRRMNNTSAELTNSLTEWITETVTTESRTALFQQMPPVIYTTANSDDSVTILSSVSVVPSVGSLDAVEAEIVAVKIA